MHCASPQKLFKLGKRRALEAEKKVVTISAEGSVLAVREVPRDQTHMEMNARGMPSDFGP